MKEGQWCVTRRYTGIENTYQYKVSPNLIVELCDWTKNPMIGEYRVNLCYSLYGDGDFTRIPNIKRFKSASSLEGAQKRALESAMLYASGIIQFWELLHFQLFKVCIFHRPPNMGPIQFRHF